MLKLLLVFLLWALGSYGCYRAFGTGAILPYAGLTIVAAGLYLWWLNRRPRA